MGSIINPTTAAVTTNPTTKIQIKNSTVIRLVPRSNNSSQSRQRALHTHFPHLGIHQVQYEKEESVVPSDVPLLFPDPLLSRSAY